LLLTAFRFQDTLPKEAITQMIATEKAFAKMALDKNTPAAFLYFLAPDGVVFEKECHKMVWRSGKIKSHKAYYNGNLFMQEWRFQAI
jgi:hypothetical protein